MRRTTISLLILFLLSLTLCVQVYAQSRDIDTIHQENLAYKQQLYDSIISFIERNPNYPQIDELYFKLAELSSELYLTEPDKPLQYFRKVLEVNPRFPMRDAVLYNIAFYSFNHARRVRDQRRSAFIQRMIREERVEPILRWQDDQRLTEDSLREALSAYQEIITEYPESKYHSESIYRLAVLLYEIGMDADEPVVYYQRARDLLNFIAEDDTDQYRYLGLYQRGWAHFSTNRFTEAIEDFSEVLNVADRDEVLRGYFEYDAIENIAYSLERMDGGDYLSPAQSVEYAQENLPRLLESEQYKERIIQRVIGLKLELNAPFHAIDYLASYLTLFPLSIENPTIIDSIGTMYQRYGYMIADEDQAREMYIAQKEKLVNEFHTGTEWYRHNSQYDIQEQLEIIRSAYEFLEPRYFNRMVLEKTDENFENYRQLIAKYESFPEFRDDRGMEWIRKADKNIVEGILILAQEHEEPYYYLQAYQTIDDFNIKYPENEDFIDYELRKFVVIETLFDILYQSLAEEDYIDEEHDLTITKEDISEIFIESSEKFLETFSSAELVQEYLEDIIRVLYKRSQIYMDSDRYVLAEADLLAMLEYEVPDELKRDVYIDLANINREFGNLAEAERFFRNASQYAEAGDRDNIVNNYRSMMLDRAQNLAADSSYVEAAEEYLRLAEEFRETDISSYVGRTHEAINAFVKAGDYQRAIDLLIGLSQYRTEPQQAYFLYASAWDIADTLMNNRPLTNELRSEYIDKYPTTNQAYRTRYEIIDQLARDPDTKYQAADLLLELHADALAGNIDHGDDSTEDIYYDALNLYRDYHDREFLISLWLGFTDTYPEDQRTDSLLELVAIEYNELGMKEEFEELARYIFTRNPDSKLYENIARQRILEKYNEITDLLNEEEFDEMFAKIEEFKALDQQLRNENLVLDLSDFYLDFEDYAFAANLVIEYRAFLADFERALDEIEENFVNAPFNELLRVNQFTTWQEHLSEAGANRLGNLVVNANRQRDTIIGLIQQARDYDDGITLELNTRALYLIGKVFDRAAEVIDAQLERFYQVSNQLIEVKDYDENEYWNFVNVINESFRKPYINFLQSEAAGWYNLLLTNFVYSLDHNDQFTDAAKDRLGEWGLLTERITLYSNTDWLAALSDERVDNLDRVDWTSVSVVPEGRRLKELSGLYDTEAVPIWLTKTDVEPSEPDTLQIDIEIDEFEIPDDKAFFLRRFDVEGEVIEAYLSFVSYETGSIIINGNAITSEVDALYDEDQNMPYYLHTVNIPPENFVIGENTILIESDTTGDNQAIILNLDITFSKR